MYVHQFRKQFGQIDESLSKVQSSPKLADFSGTWDMNITREHAIEIAYKFPCSLIFTKHEIIKIPTSHLSQPTADV